MIHVYTHTGLVGVRVGVVGGSEVVIYMYTRMRLIGVRVGVVGGSEVVG